MTGWLVGVSLHRPHGVGRYKKRGGQRTSGQVRPTSSSVEMKSGASSTGMEEERAGFKHHPMEGRGGKLLSELGPSRTFRPETRASPSPSGSPPRGETSEVHGICGQAALRQDGLPGSIWESSGLKGRTLAVGLCRRRRWPGMGVRVSRRSGGRWQQPRGSPRRRIARPRAHPLSAPRSEKLREAFIATGIALMIAVV